MRRLVSTLAVAMVISLMVVSCGRKGRVIPPSKFAHIYADMFFVDQWVSQDHNNRRQTDTLWFYEPIFEKYGYNREDYFVSVEHYLKDPSEYSAILEDARDILSASAEALRNKMTEEAARKTKSNVVCMVDVSTFENYRGRFYGKITYEFKDGFIKVTRVPDVFPFKGPKVLSVSDAVRSKLHLPSRPGDASETEVPIEMDSHSHVSSSSKSDVKTDVTNMSLDEKLQKARERNGNAAPASPERRQQIKEKIEATRQRMDQLKKNDGRQ